MTLRLDSSVRDVCDVGGVRWRGRAALHCDAKLLEEAYEGAMGIAALRSRDCECGSAFTPSCRFLMLRALPLLAGKGTIIRSLLCRRANLASESEGTRGEASLLGGLRTGGGNVKRGGAVHVTGGEIGLCASAALVSSPRLSGFAKSPAARAFFCN